MRWSSDKLSQSWLPFLISRRNSNFRKFLHEKYFHFIFHFHIFFRKKLSIQIPYRLRSSITPFPPPLHLHRFNYSEFMLFRSFKHGIYHIISVCENHKIPIQLFLLRFKICMGKFLDYIVLAIHSTLSTTSRHPHRE